MTDNQPPEINAICHHCYKWFKVRTWMFGPVHWVCDECVAKSKELRDAEIKPTEEPDHS